MVVPILRGEHAFSRVTGQRKLFGERRWRVEEVSDRNLRGMLSDEMPYLKRLSAMSVDGLAIPR
jgi:hypothetical protein